jgi:hypothetical protein
MNFADFEALLWTYLAFRIEEYQRAYSLKASLLGKLPPNVWWSRKRLVRSCLRTPRC